MKHNGLYGVGVAVLLTVVLTALYKVLDQGGTGMFAQQNVLFVGTILYGLTVVLATRCRYRIPIMCLIVTGAVLVWSLTYSIASAVFWNFCLLLFVRLSLVSRTLPGACFETGLSSVAFALSIGTAVITQSFSLAVWTLLLVMASAPAFYRVGEHEVGVSRPQTVSALRFEEAYRSADLALQHLVSKG